MDTRKPRPPLATSGCGFKKLKLSRNKLSHQLQSSTKSSVLPKTTLTKNLSNTCTEENESIDHTVCDNYDSVVSIVGTESSKQEAKGDEPDDFKVPTRRFHQRSSKSQSLHPMEQEQLQIALALSASLNEDRHLSPSPQKVKNGRHKRSRDTDLPPPLILTSSPEAKHHLAARVDEILSHEDDNGDIPCTPLFGVSALAGVACTTNGRNERDNLLEYIGRSNEMDNQSVSNAFTEDCTITAVSCHVTSPPPVCHCNAAEPSMLYTSRLSTTTTTTTTTKTVTSSLSEGDASCSAVTSISDALVTSSSIGTVCTSTFPTSSFTDYMTMWQLSTAYKEGVVESMDEFYVPALLDHIPPTKGEDGKCTVCHSEPCTALYTDRGSQTAKKHINIPKSNLSVKDHFISDLHSLFTTGLYSDVSIATSGDMTIPAHAGILACRCPNMARIMSNSSPGSYKVDLTDFTSEVVTIFLQFLYTATVNDDLISSDDMRRQVLTLAKIWEVKDLIDLLEGDSIPLPPTNQNFDCQLNKVSVTLPTSPIHNEPEPVTITTSFSEPQNSNSIIDSKISSPKSRQDTLVSPLHASCIPLSSHHDHSPSLSPSILSPPIPSLIQPPDDYYLFPGTLDALTNTSFSNINTDITHIPDRPATGISIQREESFANLSVTTVTSTTEQQNISLDSLTPKKAKVKLLSVGVTPQGCGLGTEFVTPQDHRHYNEVLQSDDNITPMPNYRGMGTPCLKDVCSQYGVRSLPKKKMIALLEEIYHYQHPLVDKDGNVIEESTVASTHQTGSKRRKIEDEGDQGNGQEESDQILEKLVKEAIISNKEMYQDIILYKPLELLSIQSHLKSQQVSICREKLMDILDQLCITYSIPRQRVPVTLKSIH